MHAVEIEIVAPADLSEAERAVWNTFRRANPLLASPYFALGFLDAVAQARGDARVAIIRRAGRIEGFLPFHKGALGHARPLGGPLGDHHGLIAPPQARFDLEQVLRGAGLSVFDFHGALAGQNAFADRAQSVDGSWVIDLSNGFDSWFKSRSDFAAGPFRNLRVRGRRIVEAPGGAVYRMQDSRPHVLQTVMAWKSAQYVRSGHFDVFSVDWTRRLIEALAGRDDPDCLGLVSSLEINGELAAAHFGMRSGGVLHYWFPVYSEAFSRLAPGLALLTEICRRLSEDGLTEIHLGPGDYAYKQQMASWQFPLAEGHAATPSMFAAARNAAIIVERGVRRLPLGPVSDLPGRALRRLDRMAGFHAA